LKESSRLLLGKAVRAIQAAQTLLDNDSAEFATGRAYYAMFYVAEALLNEKDLRFSKHGGVHGAFGEQYVKSGLFDPKFHRWLLNAFDQRLEGDYGDVVISVPQDARELIDQANEFLQEAQRFLGVTP
jgi:uncharacterized protein (UPF0332 family)